MNKLLVYIPETNNNKLANISNYFQILTVTESKSKLLKLGTIYSPQATDIIFKYTLGSYIKAIEQGANILVEAENKYHDEFIFEYQIKILQNLGYNFKYIKIYKKNKISYIFIYKQIILILKRVNLLIYIYEIIKRKLKFYNTKTNLSSILILGSSNDFVYEKVLYINNFLKKYKISTIVNSNRPNIINFLTFPYAKKNIKKYFNYNQSISLTMTINNILNYARNNGRGIIYIQNELDILETNIKPIIIRITQKYKIPIKVIKISQLINFKEELLYDFINKII